MTAYWSAEIETAPPDLIARRQEAALQRTLEACQRVPHYRSRLAEAGVDPAAVRTADDLRHLPFFDKSQLRDLQPWGIQAARLNDIVRLHATTGTTGPPCNIAFTRQDLANIGELGARNLTAMGVRREDIAWQCYGYGLWIGGTALDRAFSAWVHARFARWLLWVLALFTAALIVCCERAYSARVLRARRARALGAERDLCCLRLLGRACGS